jgi:hypothetical protein
VLCHSGTIVAIPTIKEKPCCKKPIRPKTCKIPPIGYVGVQVFACGECPILLSNSFDPATGAWQPTNVGLRKLRELSMLRTGNSSTKSDLILGCLVLLLAVAGRQANADLIFTDRAAFEAGLPAGYFFNDFSDAPDAVGSPAFSYSASGGAPVVGYSLTAPTGGLFIGPLSADPNPPKFIGPWEDTEDLIISFTTGNVYRAGIEVFIEDFDSRLAGDVTIDFSNGSSTVLSVPAVGDFGFIGIYSQTPLTSMTIRAQGGGVFTNTTSMYAAIPEPSSAALVALAVGAVLGFRDRRFI